MGGEGAVGDSRREDVAESGDMRPPYVLGMGAIAPASAPLETLIALLCFGGVSCFVGCSLNLGGGCDASTCVDSDSERLSLMSDGVGFEPFEVAKLSMANLSAGEGTRGISGSA